VFTIEVEAAQEGKKKRARLELVAMPHNINTLK
jgi:hypothetical protein